MLYISTKLKLTHIFLYSLFSKMYAVLIREVWGWCWWCGGTAWSYLILIVFISITNNFWTWACIIFSFCSYLWYKNSLCHSHPESESYPDCHFISYSNRMPPTQNGTTSRVLLKRNQNQYWYILCLCTYSLNPFFLYHYCVLSNKSIVCYFLTRYVS